MNPTPVIMGIIDDGIAFAHERFRVLNNNQWQTRVESWWLQDGPPNNPGSPIPYGRELQKANINALLKNCTRAGTVDEDLFYRKAGLIDFREEGHKSAAWRVAHGTHVMDLACGGDPIVASDRPIICVQLPTRVTADTSGGSLYFRIVDGIIYILTQAAAISAKLGLPHLPVVVNLSYGRLAGPHDGTLDLELAIDAIVSNCASHGIPLRVVLPAGNSYLSRCHARVEFQRKNQTISLLWRILPDDRTPSYLEMWLPPRPVGSYGNRIEVTITSPTGQSRSISEVSGPTDWKVSNRTYAKAKYAVSPVSKRGMILIAVAPTTTLNPADPLAPAGIWTVSIKNTGLAKGDNIQAWIQRDDSPYGYPLQGRQSYFDHRCYVRKDHAGRDNEVDDPTCAVRRESTINSIATGRHPVVVGGYIRREKVAAKYSAAGAAVPPGPPPRHPDAMAVSDDSRVHSGVLAAGSRSGSVIPLGGTSVAAPQVARWIANQLAGVGTGDRTAVQNRAGLDEAGFAAVPDPPPPERRGSGRMVLPSATGVQTRSVE